MHAFFIRPIHVCPLPWFRVFIYVFVEALWFVWKFNFSTSHNESGGKRHRSVTSSKKKNSRSEFRFLFVVFSFFFILFREDIPIELIWNERKCLYFEKLFFRTKFETGKSNKLKVDLLWTTEHCVPRGQHKTYENPNQLYNWSTEWNGIIDERLIYACCYVLRLYALCAGK